MERTTRTSHVVAWFLLASGLFVAENALAALPPGSLLHPLPKVDREIVAKCQQLPQAARDHVYIFLVNGIDPGNVCNFQGLGEYITSLGFSKVWFGQMWDAGTFGEQIRQVRAADPQARVVVVGYSAGANVVWRMAQSLNSDGTKIDLLVYLAGDTMRNCEGARPPNASRVINVRAWGLVFLAGGIINGDDINGCENVNLGFVRHSCAPTDQRFLELVTRELTQVTTTCLEQMSRIVPVANSPSYSAPNQNVGQAATYLQGADRRGTQNSVNR